MTRILVVIPCLNEEAYLEVLVEELAKSNADLPMRIIIADGGSTDRTPDIARRLAQTYPSVAYMPNPKRLQAAAVNLAVATYGANAEFLIRIDAHAGYPADYCRILIGEAEKTGASSIVVSMNTVGKTCFQKAVAATQNSKLGNGGSAHRIVGKDGMWVDHGHHALMRIKDFRAVGGYDESFSHNEDAELDWRLRQAGFEIWLTGKTSVDYYPRSKALSLFRQYIQHGRGRARNMMKHRVMPKLRQLAPAAVAPALLLALAAPFYCLAAAPLAFWAGYCLIYGAMLGIRAQNVAIAAAGPLAMIMHLGWSIGFWEGVIAGIRKPK